MTGRRPLWLAAAVVLAAAAGIGWAVGGPQAAVRATLGTLGVGVLLVACSPVLWVLFVLVMAVCSMGTGGFNKPRTHPRTGPPPDGATPPPPAAPDPAHPPTPGDS